LLEPSDT